MSRQPGSTGHGLVYDEKLLEQAPQVTRGQRQEGYDADILNPPAPTRTPPADFNERGTDIESGSSPNEKHLAAGGYDPVNHPVKRPFWKTTKGTIILAIVALVIIAAAVGGGVGGHFANKGSGNLAASNNSTGSSTGTSTAPTEGTQQASTPTPAATTPGCSGQECPTRTRTDRASSTLASSGGGTPIPNESITGPGSEGTTIPVVTPSPTSRGEGVPTRAVQF